MTRKNSGPDQAEPRDDRQSRFGSSVRSGAAVVRSARPSAVTSFLRRTAVRERRATFGLSTFEAAGPLTFTRGGMYMWFLLGGQPWDFRTTGDRLQRWDQQTFRFSSLRGRTLKLRATTRPYPAYEYARSLDEDTPEPLPTQEGQPGWDDFLYYGQKRLQMTGLDQKFVGLGVWVGPNPRAAVRNELIHGVDHPDPATVRVLEEMAKVEKIVKGDGLNGRLMSPRELAFLYHRSLSMGIPAPVHAGVAGSRWEPEDMAMFARRREWIYEPLGSTVRVIAEHQGRTVERHVAVLTLGAMPEMTWPENGRDPLDARQRQAPVPGGVEHVRRDAGRPQADRGDRR